MLLLFLYVPACLVSYHSSAKHASFVMGGQNVTCCLELLQFFHKTGGSTVVLLHPLRMFSYKMGSVACDTYLYKYDR